VPADEGREGRWRFLSFLSRTRPSPVGEGVAQVMQVVNDKLAGR
jgi:hypothetical protein